MCLMSLIRVMSLNIFGKFKTIISRIPGKTRIKAFSKIAKQQKLVKKA